MELAQMLFYTMGTIAVSVYLIDKIKEKIQDLIAKQKDSKEENANNDAPAEG